MKEVKHKTKIKTGTAFVVFVGIVGVLAGLYFFSIAKHWGGQVIENASENLNQVNLNSSLNGIDNTNQAVANTNTLPFKIYTNNLYGFTLELDKDSTVSEEEVEGITTISFGQGNYAAIMSPDMEGIVTESAPPLSEEKLTLDDTIEARLILGSSAKDGSEVTYILFTYKDNLYEFAGDANFLDKVVNTLNFN